MALLAVSDLTRRFGGLIAVNDVTLSVEPGEIRGLIGPNGAGKTTLFNLLTGVLRPTAGRVRFEGTSITGEPTHRLVRRGIVRTYQLSQLFAGFTVFRNVLVALHGRMRAAGLLGTDRAGARPRCAAAATALAGGAGAQEKLSGSWSSSALRAARRISPAACRTATSGCCKSRLAWRRRRGCSCWTNRSPACCTRMLIA